MLLCLRSGLGTEASQRLEASFAQGLYLSCAFPLCLEQHLGQEELRTRVPHWEGADLCSPLSRLL